MVDNIDKQKRELLKEDTPKTEIPTGNEDFNFDDEAGLSSSHGLTIEPSVDSNELENKSDLSGDIEISEQKTRVDSVESVTEDDLTPPTMEYESQDNESTKKLSNETSDFEPTWRKHQKVVTSPRRRKRLKYIILSVIIICLLAVIVPVSRHLIIGFLPIERDFNMSFQDQDTGLPISDLTVNLAGQTKATDQDGKVYFTNIRLGRQKLHAERLGFSTLNKDIILEPWTVSSLDIQTLQVIGVRFPIKVVDFITKKPIANVKVTHDKLDTISDSKGSVMLVVPPLTQKSINIIFTVNGYHKLPATLKDANSKTVSQFEMIPDSLAYFVSNRTGKYGIYSTWLDGSHQQEILPGAGNERADNMVFSQSPDGKFAILVTTRNAITDRINNTSIINELFVINLSSGTTAKVSNGPITPVGWSGNNYVYIYEDQLKTQDDASRSQILLLDPITQRQTSIISSNSFVPGTVVIENNIYFSSQDNFHNSTKSFFSVADSLTNKITKLITDKLVNQISRISLRELQLQTNTGDVIKFDIESHKSSSAVWLNQTPQFVSNSQKGVNMWSDTRDGQANLILSDDGSGEQKTIFRSAGKIKPLNWLNDRLFTFSVSDDSGNKLYVIDKDTEKYQVIGDISNI